MNLADWPDNDLGKQYLFTAWKQKQMVMAKDANRTGSGLWFPLNWIDHPLLDAQK